MNKYKTPIDLDIKKNTIIVPAEGWKDNTYYEVEVAFNSVNSIHKSLFYSGFVRDGKPCGYNCLFNPTYDGHHQMSDAYYMKVLRTLDLDLKW